MILVEPGSRSHCNSKRRLELTEPEGAIASLLAEEHGFGTRRCPWVIRAKPGQKINITLLDFGLAVRNEGTRNSHYIDTNTSRNTYLPIH